MILDDEKMTREDFFILYPRETLEDRFQLLELSENAVKLLLYYIDEDKPDWNEKKDLKSLEQIAYRTKTTKRRVGLLRTQLKILKFLEWEKKISRASRVYPLYDNIHSALIRGYNDAN